MNVYVVGQLKQGREMDGSEDTWEVRGIFHDKQRAVDLCEDDEHFVMEFPLDTDVGKATSMAEVGWYPMVETEAEGIERLAQLSVGGGVT